MSRRKRKFSFIRFLLVVFIFIALIACLFFAYQLVGDKLFTNKQEEVKEPSVPSSNEETKISVKDYTVYIDDEEELGFNFIVATLNFTTTNDTLYYDLANLTNSERDMKLSDTEGYIQKIEAANYDLSKLNIKTEIRSDTNSTDANIIIPFNSKTGVLNVYNGEKLSFDLTKNVKNASDLKPYNTPDQTVVKSDDYSISVSKAYTSTMMLHNNEEYDSSGIDVYTFKLNISSAKEGLMIEEAQFIKDGSSAAVYALDESFSSMKVDNIIKKTLTSGMDGALFFELQKNNGEAINYDGVLRIKLSDSNDLIEIPTTIK